MRKTCKVLLLASWVSCSLFFMGCGDDELKEIIPDEKPEETPVPPTPEPPVLTSCEVPIAVDWTIFGDAPTSMTLLFYPKDGAVPVKQVVNRSDSAKVDLPVGSYNVVLFNGKAEDFTTIGFRGMDKYDTAELYLHDIETRADEGMVVHNPEAVGIAKMEGFEVTKEMLTKATNPLVKLIPQCVDATTAVQVRVEGIDKLEQVSGMMVGMSESYFIAIGKTGSSQVSHIMDDWQIIPDADNPTTGWVKGYFASFGLPVLEQELEEEDIQLELSFKLADRDTVVTLTHHVGKLFEKTEEGEETEEGETIDMKVEIIVPIQPEPEPEPDPEPDPKPDPEPENPNPPTNPDEGEGEGGSGSGGDQGGSDSGGDTKPDDPKDEGGFGADVEDWETEGDQDVTVKSRTNKQLKNKKK